VVCTECTQLILAAMLVAASQGHDRLESNAGRRRYAAVRWFKPMRQSCSCNRPQSAAPHCDFRRRPPKTPGCIHRATAHRDESEPETDEPVTRHSQLHATVGSAAQGRLVEAHSHPLRTHQVDFLSPSRASVSAPRQTVCAPSPKAPSRQMIR
jgi:hypothetical protein